jgi:hypothetical protein
MELGTHTASSSGERYCEAHAPDGSTDFAQRPCASCNLPEVLGAEGRCAACDPVRRAKYLKSREILVKGWLEAEGLQYVSHDRMLDGGACGKKRPDFLFDAGTHYVILEVDERQHEGDAYECEQTRMVNLAQSAGIPTVFLRFNPDGDMPLTGRAVPLACRCESLIRWLRWMMVVGGEGNPAARGAFCEVRYLYFDGCDGQAPPTMIGPALETFGAKNI